MARTGVVVARCQRGVADVDIARDDADMGAHPRLVHTAIDSTDIRAAAEFYRELLGLTYRPGDEPPPDGSIEDVGWLTLRDDHGANVLAFQRVDELKRTTWPEPDVPMQLHLDFTVPTREELEHQRGRAEALGAQLILDRSDDPDEPLYVMADLDGHPFCLFVA
jgi:catechol 2,3-dioxygenase-like lactoylglutathione lyase family enzyme